MMQASFLDPRIQDDVQDDGDGEGLENRLNPEAPKQAPRDLEGFKRHKPVLKRLYMIEKKPLNEVMSIMKKQYKFKPT